MGKGKITTQVTGLHSYRKLPRAELKKQIRSIWETPDDCSVIAHYLLLAFQGMEQAGVYDDGDTSLSYGPGEFVMESRNLYDLFHIRHASHSFASKNAYLTELLAKLQALGLLSYRVYGGNGKALAYYHIRIVDWYDKTKKHGRNSAVKRGSGYAYLHIDKLKTLLTRNGGRISQHDALVDLWLHLVYQDEHVEASEQSPLVSFEGTEGGLLSTTYLAERWGWLRSSAYAFLKKLDRREYIAWYVFGGRKGSLLYMPRYLSAVLKQSEEYPDAAHLEVLFDCRLKTIPVSEPVPYQTQLEDYFIVDMDKLNGALDGAGPDILNTIQTIARNNGSVAVKARPLHHFFTTHFRCRFRQMDENDHRLIFGILHSPLRL